MRWSTEPEYTYFQESKGVAIPADDARHCDLFCTFTEKQTFSRRKNLINVGTKKDGIWSVTDKLKDVIGGKQQEPRAALLVHSGVLK